MKKILVTGSSGLVGAAIVEELRALGHSVTGMSRSVQPDSVQCDLADVTPETLEALVPDIDWIVHASAGIPRGTQPDDESLKACNIRMDEHIFELAERRQTGVLYFSTCGLYAPSSEVMDEAAPVAIQGNYYESKHLGEQLFLGNGRNVVARIPSPYGDGMSEYVVLSRFMEQALSERLIKVWGSGERTQNFVHARDVARFVELALLADRGGLYNVAASESVSMLEAARLIQSLVPDCKLEFAGEPSAADEQRFAYSSARAMSDFGWRDEVSLRAGLEALLSDKLAGH